MEDPNNARNEETENRSVEMPMRSLIKVTVAGNPAAPIIVPESWYVDEWISQAAEQSHKKCHQEFLHTCTRLAQISKCVPFLFDMKYLVIILFIFPSINTSTSV